MTFSHLINEGIFNVVDLCPRENESGHLFKSCAGMT